MTDHGSRLALRGGGDSTPEESARGLMARVRAGELVADAVRLAALAGHPGARLLEPEVPCLAGRADAEVYRHWKRLARHQGKLPLVACGAAAWRAALLARRASLEEPPAERWEELAARGLRLIARSERWVELRLADPRSDESAELASWAWAERGELWALIPDRQLPAWLGVPGWIALLSAYSGASFVSDGYAAFCSARSGPTPAGQQGAVEAEGLRALAAAALATPPERPGRAGSSVGGGTEA